MLKSRIPIPRYPVVHTVWRIIDSHWVCVLAESVSGRSSTPMKETCFGVLCDYLHNHGFDIPESIDYCIATNDEWRLKFRRFGNLINIYLTINRYLL